MKSAFIFLFLLSASAHADWCSVCDSIRNPYGAQTIPLLSEPEPDDDSRTEAGLSGRLLPRKRESMKIDLRLVQYSRPLIYPGPNPPPAQPVYTVAMQAGRQINEIRRAQGLPPLVFNDYLNREALRFAQELHARRGAPLSHDSAFGQLQDRLRMMGYNSNAVGENIAERYRGANDVVNGWMSSPGHRANIMAETPASQRFRRQGIAEFNGFWVHIFSD